MDEEDFYEKLGDPKTKTVLRTIATASNSLLVGWLSSNLAFEKPDALYLSTFFVALVLFLLLGWMVPICSEDTVRKRARILAFLFLLSFGLFFVPSVRNATPFIDLTLCITFAHDYFFENDLLSKDLLKITAVLTGLEFLVILVQALSFLHIL